METVFGKLRTETYAYTEGSDDVQNADGSYNLNVWTRKTVETLADGSTYTVYTNYLGQTILDDSANAAGAAHTYTYYEYDAIGDPTLEASSSAIAGYWDGQETTAIGAGVVGATNDYRIHLSLSATGGLVQEYAYTPITVSGSNAPAGLLRSKSVADGLVYPSTGSYSYYNPTSVLQESFTYAPQTVYTGGYPVTTYPVATDTVYTTATSTLSSADSPATPTTQISTVYYPGTSQPETITTILPAVSTSQNGPGVAAYAVAWYDQEGQLVLSRDADGYFTCYEYDPVAGLLSESIADANTADAAEFNWSDLPVDSTTGLPIDPMTGEPIVMAPGGGQNLVSNYSYDNQDRLAQTLGPAHTADIDGTATLVPPPRGPSTTTASTKRSPPRATKRSPAASSRWSIPSPSR